MKRITLVLAPLVSLTFLVGCKNETPDPGPFTVTIPEEVGLSISKTIAEKGKDFVATFSIDDEQTTLILPEQLNKVTSGKETINDYTYTPDANRLTASFKIPAKDIVGNIIIDFELFDIHFVTKSEFEDALSFKNIQFMQKNHTNGTLPFKTEKIEFSPTVFHKIYSVFGIFESEYQYQEEYVSKNQDGTYDRYYRDSEDGNYTLTKDVSGEYFKLPQSENILEKIIEAGKSYSDFEYDGYDYTAEFDEDTMTIKFKYKKIVKNYISPETTNYEYKEITPDLPDVPSNL